MNTFKKLFSISAIVALIGTLMPMYALGASYSNELEGAYEYAYDNGITTMDSIDNANMYGSLTRIAMAKMMANFSMDVLGNEPDTDMECDFPDVSDALDAQYDNGVTNACQLGLMGVGVDNFDPYGLVTRAQFGTVLSRALFGDMYNGADPYYADHLEALQDAGIMNNISNPMQLEVRGYVMLMMQRADEDASVEDGCSAEELLACITADDYDDCIAACSGEEEEEDEEVIVEELAGDLTVDLNASSPDSNEDIPLAVPRTTLLTFDVEADDADVTLYNLTLEFVGYGDYADVDEVTVYNAKNMKVSKTKNLNDTETTISFENDVVVKEGGTETFTVAATVNGSSDTTYGLAVVDMDTSAEDVDGLPVEGDDMKAVTATNVGALTMSIANAASNTITVGEEEKLAGFKLENDTDFEDITLYALTLTLDGVDEDIFSDLVLYADGEEVADDLEFYNDELVANIDYAIEKESSYIEFELFGSVSEIDNGAFTINIAEEADLYAKGDKYGFSADITDYTSADIGDIIIEGSEVTTSFDKSSIDEAKSDTDDVLVGTIELKALEGDYDINSYSICVDTSNLTNGDADIKDLTLGGNSYDSLDNDGATNCPGNIDEYVYEDITLAAGVKEELQLVVDFEDTPAEGDYVVFDVSFDNEIEVEDDYNDVTYTEGDVDDIFSTVSYNTKTITIEEASFDSIVTDLNDRTVVLGNQEELVYKGKVTIGDADDVELVSIDFTDAQAGGEDLNDIIQDATLTIGNTSYDSTDIEADKIEFDYINHEFYAGDSNVVVELVVQFKTKDGVSEDIEFVIAANSDVTLEDSEGDDLAAANVDVVNTSSCTLTLTDAGSLDASWEYDDDSSTTMNMFTEQDKYALAGSEEKVLLGKVKLEADQEDMEVETITYTFDDVGGDFFNSYEDFYFQLNGAEDFIGDATVSYAADVTTVEFENLDFVVSKSANTYANLYATVKATDLDPDAAQEGAIAGASVEGLEITAIEYVGESSDDDEADLGAVTVAANSYDTTVVMNTIAMVELEGITKSLYNGSNVVIGELTVTPTDQNTNTDADGDAILALLDTLAVTATATDITVDDLYVRKIGGTTAVSLGIVGADTDVTALGDDAEIDGTVTFEILADLSNRTDPDASVQLQISDVTSDVVFTDGQAIDVTLKLPEGVSKEYTVSTN